MFRFKSWGTSSSSSAMGTTAAPAQTTMQGQASAKDRISSTVIVGSNDDNSEKNGSSISVDEDADAEMSNDLPNREDAVHTPATLKRERTTDQEKVEMGDSGADGDDRGNVAFPSFNDDQDNFINATQQQMMAMTPMNLQVPERMSSLSAGFYPLMEDSGNKNDTSSVTSDPSRFPSLKSLQENGFMGRSHSIGTPGFPASFTSAAMVIGSGDRTESRAESLSSLQSFSMFPNPDTPPTPVLFAFGMRSENSAMYEKASSSAAASISVHGDYLTGFDSHNSDAFNIIGSTPPTQTPLSPAVATQPPPQARSTNKYVPYFFRPPLFFRSSKSRSTTGATQQQQVQAGADASASASAALAASSTLASAAPAASSGTTTESISTLAQRLRHQPSAGSVSHQSPRTLHFEMNTLPSVQHGLEKLAINDQSDSRKRRRQDNPNAPHTPTTFSSGSRITTPVIEQHVSSETRQFLSRFPSQEFSLNQIRNDDGYLQLLYEAIRDGRPEALHLIKTKSFSNLDTALFVAAKFKNLEILQTLLSAGVDPNAPASLAPGVSPLLIAAHHGYDDVAAMLCRAGADIAAEKQNGSNVMFSACKNGHLPVLRILHACGATFRHGFRKFDGMHALHVASERGHAEIVEYILDHMAGDVAIALADKRTTCLHLACENHRVDVIRVLVSRGADVCAEDAIGVTPLSLCVQQGDLSILRILLNVPRTVLPRVQLENSSTHPVEDSIEDDSLATAASSPQRKRVASAVSELFSKYFNEFFLSNEIQDNAEYSPFIEEKIIPYWFANREEQIETVSKRISHKSKDGSNLLVAACKSGKSIAIIFYLARIVPDPKVFLDGLSPLLYLSKNGRTDMVLNYLGQKQKQLGYWDPGMLLNDKSNFGWTALHWAARAGHHLTLEILISFLRECLKFPSQGAVKGSKAVKLDPTTIETNLRKLVDAELDNGMTPLYIAAHHGHLSAIKVLVDAGNADIARGLGGEEERQENANEMETENTTNGGHQTRINSPLFTAVKHGHLQIVRFSAEKLDKDTIMARVRGMNILHVACLHQQLPILRFLVEDLGLDPSSFEQSSLNGWLPLHLASRVGGLNIIKYLIETDRRTPIDAFLHTGTTNNAANTNNDAPEQGYTALHVAVSHGRINIVKYLIAAGADMTSTIGPGQRTLHELAVMSHRPSVAAWLEKASKWNRLQLVCDLGDVESFIKIVTADDASHLTDALPYTAMSEDLIRIAHESSPNESAPCSCKAAEGEMDLLTTDVVEKVSQIKTCDAIVRHWHANEVDAADATLSPMPFCSKMASLIRRSFCSWSTQNHFLYPRSVQNVAMAMHLINRRSFFASQRRRVYERHRVQGQGSSSISTNSEMSSTNSDELAMTIIDYSINDPVLDLSPLPYLPQDVLEYILSFLGRG